MLLATGPAPAFHVRRAAPRAAGLAAASASAAATTWEVSPGSTGACTPADPNCATIQAAVNAASGGDTIQVAAGTYAEHVSVGKSLALSGAGAASTTVDGTQSGTVFTVNPGATVSLSGVTVSNGKGPSFDGGGIHNDRGMLSVTDITVSGNTSSFGGGINSSRGTLNITNSTVSGNSTFFSNGGGIRNGGVLNITNTTVSGNSASEGGGGIFNGSTLNVTDITVSGNSAKNGGGIHNGDGARMNLTDSTVGDNSALFGGGISNDGGTLSVTDSTVSGNSGGEGGGIANHHRVFARFIIGGVLNLTNSTVSHNSATSGGGGVFKSDFAGTIVNARNNIIADNTAPSAPDFRGALASQGHNLIGSTDGLTGATPADLTGLDPMLLPLGDYGGPTRTHALRPGSPAIDAGDDAVLLPPLNLTTDQRGSPRKVGSRVDIGAVEFNPGEDMRGIFQFGAATYTVGEGGGHVVITVTRVGQLGQAATVDFATADNDPGSLLPCGAATGNASSRCDYGATSGTLQFAPGDTAKTLTVIVNDDAFVEGAEAAGLLLGNPTGQSALGQQSAATLQITDDDTTPPTTNPIDDSQFFVRQHYHDFFSREPDAPGLAHWTNVIESCMGDAQCREVRRINVSGAFFLSIEFEQTGYLIERTYKAAYGDATGTSTLNGPHTLQVPIVRFEEFLPDTQRIGRGVVVLQPGWEAQLEANKVAFFREFVQRPRFLADYPLSLSPTDFVDRLNGRARGPLDAAERLALIDELTNNNTTEGRAGVLREVAEDSTLEAAEKNRAFVLMQYFGYLRRNPNSAPDSDYTGYEFWLGSLEKAGGNFVQAELVKAFISSIEYRSRFGQ